MRAKFCVIVSGFFLTLAPSALAVDPVPGFADLHNHVFAELAHAGAWYHGTVEGELAHAMSSCDVEFDPLALWGDHARVKIPVISTLIGRIRGSRGDTGSHLDKVAGAPQFAGWPRWDSLAHQQNWEGYLKSAHEHGMTLMVLSVVNFEPFCELMPEENRKFETCNDMDAAYRQIEAAHRFAKKHPWFKIVRTPAEARSAIWQGRLAVVLSIEVDRIFGDEDWRPQLEKVYSMGVRTLQPAAHINTRFAGAAVQHPIHRLFQWLDDFDRNGHWYDLIQPWKFGVKTDSRGFNLLGLTPEGIELVTEMMKRGMLIDMAHLSEQGVKEMKERTIAHNNYPVYISHGHFRAAMDDGKYSEWEKSSPDWVLEYIKQSGGMFGLRTGPEKTKAYPESIVPNDCQGSTKSFAQTYQYGQFGKGINVALGSDLNGFIQQLRPRFGGPDETCGAEEDEVVQAQQRLAQKKPLKKRFDQSGLGDVSQLPDVLTELKNFGVDIRPLNRSSETFIRMWEKAVRLAK